MPRAHQTQRDRRLQSLLASAVFGFAVYAGLQAFDSEAADTPEHPGLELLLNEPLSIGVFTVEELQSLWQTWTGDALERAEAAPAEERRRLIFERYGLIDRGDLTAEKPWLPLGYTLTESGRLAANCLVCHGGKVAGTVIPGLPNSHQDFGGLIADLAALRAMRSGGDPEKARKSSSMGIPLNFVKGSTNATMYSILLGSMRDEHLDVRMPPQLSQPLVHNSIDAPPWWHFQRKERIYWDGMAPKSVRTLMQFAMAPGLSGETIRSWEDEFTKIRSFIGSIAPPEYPFAIDESLAARGKQSFERVCSECHGTYGDQPSYPERTVPLDLLGTDPVRLGAIHQTSKEKYNRSWFANYGKHPVVLDPKGYVAPPLDGIWASGPYFHNGSVPTLWHVLHPDQRPRVWRRTEDGYDQDRVGLEVDELTAVPSGLEAWQQRLYFDTSQSSHSAAGHRFPERLSPEERLEVLEYLKTL